MRWEDLFSDMEAQLTAAAAVERESEVLDRIAAERAGIDLSDRLRAQRRMPIDVRLRGGELLTGEVVDVAAEWCLLGEAARRHLLPLSAIAVIGGLGSHAAPPAGEVLRRLGLGHVLRALTGQGRPVRVVTEEGVLLGRIVAVGRDHLDLAPDPEGFGASRPTGLLAVPFSALLRVSSG